MISSPPLTELEEISRRVRADVIRMSHRGRAPHLGSGLSCVDILVAAYWSVLRIEPQRPNDPLRDRFILSKGHAAAALYAVLARRGFFPLAQLSQFNQAGGCLPEQPSPHGLPGIEAATGSLGHGLPIGLGMALAGRIQRLDYRVVVVLSDGECNEGSVWEAAMTAAAQQLKHVAVIVDYNGWQATGRSNQILALAPLAEKWQAFGWRTVEVDGHDLCALRDALAARPVAASHAADEAARPLAVIAHTMKGKGVSFMEDDNNWHYRVPNDTELHAALVELGVAQE